MAKQPLYPHVPKSKGKTGRRVIDGKLYYFIGGYENMADAIEGLKQYDRDHPGYEFKILVVEDPHGEFYALYNRPSKLP